MEQNGDGFFIFNKIRDRKLGLEEMGVKQDDKKSFLSFSSEWCERMKNYEVKYVCFQHIDDKLFLYFTKRRYDDISLRVCTPKGQGARITDKTIVSFIRDMFKIKKPYARLEIKELRPSRGAAIVIEAVGRLYDT